MPHAPLRRSRQAQVLLRKRREYAEMVPEFYDIANTERSEDEIGALRQVRLSGAVCCGGGLGRLAWGQLLPGRLLGSCCLGSCWSIFAYLCWLSLTACVANGSCD